MPEPKYVDDRDQLNHAEIVRIEWPTHVKKPVFGIVQDNDHYPKWTKFRRFLENNSFDFELFAVHRHDWIEQAQKFDVIVGIPSSVFYHLFEIRNKYEILETYMGKRCYPSPAHARLYEDKCLEAYISKATGIPFAKTYISHNKEDALHLLEHLEYPLVSKIVPSSGSQGVELVHTFHQGRRIVRQVFSRAGRKTHQISYRQKNFVYFQEFIPNSGYDIRVIVVGNWVFGFDRKVPPGDFRASGMHTWEKRELPAEAMRIALKVNQIVKSPVLAVDMLHGLDGTFRIIEFSPLYQMDSSEELQVNGVSGVYIFEAGGSYHFEKGKYWVAELALKEFLVKDYLLDFLKADLPTEARG
jgi:glutathione synthase/RimK-type ligase-like ATP-grasp enzyme